MNRTLVAAAALLLAGAADRTLGRTWTDDTGAYTIEADLVAFDDDQVILKRSSDGSLGSIDPTRLSEADLAYLQSEDAKAVAGEWADAPQTWTMRSGLKVPGRIVDFTQRQVTVQRRRGHVYVNDRRFENLPKIYKKIAPLVIGHFEGNAVSDEKSLTAWLVHRKGQPQTYTVDGVVLELESGDEYAVPFFLLSDADREVLQPGWEQWRAASGDYDTQQDHSFELQSLAAAYQRNAEQSQQIARLQLGMQAVDAGVTSLWEVTLYPAAGGQPLWVVVPGRDSRVAQQTALQQNPGYRVGPARRVSR